MNDRTLLWQIIKNDFGAMDNKQFINWIDTEDVTLEQYKKVQRRYTLAVSTACSFMMCATVLFVIWFVYNI